MEGIWGVACVGKDRLIVPLDVRGFVDSNSHHPKLVPKALDIVAGCLHSNELADKGARLARCLTLRVPKYRRRVEEDNKASARASGQRVSSIIHDHYRRTHACAISQVVWACRRAALR